MRDIQTMVSNEVHYCVSGLMHELLQQPKYNEEFMDLIGRINDDDEHEDVYEHWIVSSWLADRLEERGEIVERDFYGLIIWGRRTTGQAIYADYVIEQIYAALDPEYKNGGES